MQKDSYFYLAAAAGFLILVLGGYVLLNLNLSEYKHSVKKGGVDFVSDEAEPSEIFSSMRDAPQFMISPAFVEKGPENSYMASALTMLNTVLAAKGKSVIVVGRVMGSDGKVAHCQTNLGDVKVNKGLSAEECNSILADSGSVRVFIDLPDKKLSSPKVLLERSLVRISTPSFDAISGTSFAFISNLYTDSAKIIETVNSLALNIGR